ncbi:MAG TPA: NAD(P)H-dependent oxidoreductase [Steroidobacteraceae bacterium]|nr:NAD(P)H-dependent oxidoreductase [Steroidobacteraceae bacterium]
MTWRVLIVHAHHEAQSFNAAMTREAAAALIAAGSEVIVSDLYAMQFDPVSDRRNFVTIKNSSRLRQQDEEAHASEHNGFAPALQTEMDKLAWCDTLILQFPLWWFGMPAILKGWIDRVFAVGRAYGNRRWFDVGVFAGKRAMCSVTVGGLEHVYTEQGINGPMSSILFPINHGILGFTGFAVIEPFVVYGPTRISDDERLAHLRRYRERVVGLDSAPIIAGPKTSDYDENLVLKTRRGEALDSGRSPAAPSAPVSFRSGL